MTNYLDRLTAALAPLEDEWGDWALSPRQNTDRLLKLRPVTALAPMLRHIEEISAAWTFNHALKRAYSSLREAIVPLTTPLLACMKKKDGPPLRWGGSGVYWDVVTKT